MQYAWLIFSLLVLAIWVGMYFWQKDKNSRREMLVVSLWTSLLGLTEPLFVPEYWDPPSLFDLAQNTGFDIESLIFAFAVGGIAVVAYEAIFKSKHVIMSMSERHSSVHHLHFWAVISPFLAFGALLAVTSLNPIHPAIIAMVVGFVVTLYCRRDLLRKMLVSGLIFTGIYFVVFSLLNLSFPGYTEAVWNLSDISGVVIIGVPLEELLWAFTFGLYWSSVYEHLMWRKLKES